MVDNKTRVNVHSILTAVSSRPVGLASLRNFQLSQLGHAMGRHSVHLIFYYAKSPLRSFDVDPIRESLSEILSLYPPVTGRMTRNEEGNWVVKCNDAGVRVLRARVSLTLDEWLRSAEGSEERDLTVWEDMPECPGTWSPFRIQVVHFPYSVGFGFLCCKYYINDFEGGGVAIGLSCTHMHADTTSLTLLVKAWSEVHRRQTIAYQPFFKSLAPYEAQGPNFNTKSTNHLATKSQAQNPSVKMATATFKFSDSTIKQCLSEIHDKCPDATPFDFLAALFWTSVVHLKGTKHDHKHSLSVCVDFRRLLQEPLPHGYFGNALHFSLLSANKEEMESGGLGHIAQLVHGHVSGLKEEEFWSDLHWLESQKGEGGKYEPAFTMYGPRLTCVNMEHMIVGDQSMMYSAIFDSAKPVHVSCHIGNVEGEGLIMVMPSSEGLGRTVMGALPEEEIAKLCEDQAISCLEPIMFFRGKL